MRISLSLILVLLLFSCVTTKSNAVAPFTLGKVYTQRWVAEDNLKQHGYNVIIPIIKLDKENAILKDIYHKRKVIELKIKLKPIGAVAIAKFPENSFIKNKTLSIDGTVSNKEKVILKELNDDELVLSYWVNNKIKYHKISNIRHNPLKSYPNSVMAEFD